MHGRKKISTNEPKDPDAEKARVELERLRVLHYQDVFNRIRDKRVSREWDEDMLSLTAELLKVNPDFYTLWNIRRTVLHSLGDTDSKETRHDLGTKELKLSELCIPVNPKSYYSWYHRMYILEHFCEPIVLENELKLCDAFLNMDDRNFHCWDYRRYVVRKLNRNMDVEELDYTTKKIHQNFSNYSAWHYRSKLLLSIYGTKSPEDYQTIIRQELDLVHQAVFTEPKDQSPWLYYRWLIGEHVLPRDVIEQELNICQQLLELEPDSKWALYISTNLMKILGKDTQSILEIYKKLEELDSSRKYMYRDLSQYCVEELKSNTT